MTDQLISFGTAELAKQKGFDFNKIEYSDSKTLELVNNYKERLEYFKTEKDSALIKIPTQSLLQKWVRERHKIWILVDFQGAELCWYTIVFIGKPTIIGDVFKTYEKALEAGLQEALKLIK
jgi:hypothetical protein